MEFIQRFMSVFFFPHLLGTNKLFKSELNKPMPYYMTNKENVTYLSTRHSSKYVFGIKQHWKILTYDDVKQIF